MIETKEQYDRIMKNAEFQGKMPVEHVGLLAETIEALREVARAAKPAALRLSLIQKAGPLGKSPHWTQRLIDTLDDLPDWLTDG